ncbi:MAG: hypothetical protein NUV46_03085 [Nanoarchaeota archaeon]|nr:hypothetical protein [Nanoarchaeota archaeon]
MVKKRVKRKASPKKSQKSVNKNIDKITSPRKVRKVTKSLIYSLAVFIVSLVLYLVTTDFWESLFGFILIISGALVILFGIIEIILFLVRRRNTK